MFKRERSPYLQTPELSDQEASNLREMGIDGFKLISVISYLKMIERCTGSVRNQRILDIGCGSSARDYRGRVSSRPPVLPLVCAMRGAKAYGIDPGPQDNMHLKCVRDHGGEILQHTLASFEEQIKQGTDPFILKQGFDIVVTNDVWGWNPDPSLLHLDSVQGGTLDYLEDIKKQRELFLGVSAQVLKPGGIALYDWKPDGNIFDRPDLLYTSWQKPEEPQQTLFGRIFGR